MCRRQEERLSPHSQANRETATDIHVYGIYYTIKKIHKNIHMHAVMSMLGLPYLDVIEDLRPPNHRVHALGQLQLVRHCLHTRIPAPHTHMSQPVNTTCAGRAQREGVHAYSVSKRRLEERCIPLLGCEVEHARAGMEEQVLSWREEAEEHVLLVPVQ